LFASWEEFQAFRHLHNEPFESGQIFIAKIWVIASRHSEGPIDTKDGSSKRSGGHSMLRTAANFLHSDGALCSPDDRFRAPNVRLLEERSPLNSRKSKSKGPDGGKSNGRIGAAVKFLIGPVSLRC
jgi:hypothetical protein